MSTRSVPTALLLLLPLLAAPARAADALGGSGLLLFRTDSGVELVRHGRPLSLPIPSGVVLEQVAPLREGALLTGERPSGSASELYLARLAGKGLEELAPPASRIGRLRSEPVALARDGAFAGVAWLEGDAPNRLAVRFAERAGEGWGEVREIAPPGPGSQVALAAAPLANGGSLLVWSRYDGHDDEVVFSVERDGTWSAPRPVAEDNSVPDITPSLIADGDGALAAWSRYDGHEYRVVTSRFDGTSWTRPREIGEAGSLAPGFVPGEGGPPRLLYRDARAGAWVVAELGASGEALRRSEAKAGRRERPVVVAGDDGTPILRWRDAEERAPWRR